jgi:hypothetical protein
LHCGNSQNLRTGVHLTSFCQFGNGVISRLSAAVQLERRDEIIAHVERGASRRGGRPHDTRAPFFGPNLLGQRPRSAPPARSSTCLARSAGTASAAVPMPVRAAPCGKVPNRTSRPFRPVTPLHLLSCRAGTGPQLKRRLPIKGVKPAFDRHRHPTEETKKREFQRQAPVRAD